MAKKVVDRRQEYWQLLAEAMLEHGSAPVMDVFLNAAKKKGISLLESVSVEERLRDISSEERLRGLAAEERLRGLATEERAQLKLLLAEG